MSDKTCTFQILFTSDVHAAFRDYSYSLDTQTPFGGLSKVATLLKKEKSGFDGQTFIVDVGDIIQGNGTGPLVKLDKFGKDFRPFPLLAAFDAAGYDIVSLGNHEFNFGVPALLNAFDGFKGEKLCANILDSENRLLPGFKPFTIRHIENGPRVAFIGVVSPNADVWDKANMTNYSALNAAESVRHTIGHLKTHDMADLFVVLGHMHTTNELNRPGSGAADVAALNPEIDLFLGAHFHRSIGTKDDQFELLGTIKFAENLDSAKSYGKVLVTASLDGGRWRVRKPGGSYDESDVKTDIISLDKLPPVENDPAVEQATQKAHELIQDYMRNTAVGTLVGGPLVPPPEIAGTCEAVLRPTGLTSLIAKMLREFAQTDIAAASLNNYTANCLPGKITLGSVARIYVYDNNTVYRLEMTGRQIKQWMEWSYAFFGTPVSGRPDYKSPAVNPATDLTIPYGTRKIYMHDKFDGLSYEVDLTKPVGSRIIHLRLDNRHDQVFDMDKKYTVAVTNYRATACLTMHSDDGVFTDPSEPVAKILQMDVASPKGNINVLDWLEEYITDKLGGTVDAEQVVSNNWRILPIEWNAELRKKAIEMINSGQLEYDFTKPVKIGDLSGK